MPFFGLPELNALKTMYTPNKPKSGKITKQVTKDEGMIAKPKNTKRNRLIRKAVKRAMKDFGETFKRLANE